MKLINLYIKNMVCLCCIRVVKHELIALGIEVLHVELGKAIVQFPKTVTYEAIQLKLREVGLELLQSKEEIIVQYVKQAVQKYLQRETDVTQSVVLSDYISQALGKNYNFLSKCFSKLEGSTIENYAIRKKVERVKKLMAEDGLTLSQIAFELGYGSVQYLSTQFKKVTGVSASEYKSMVKSDKFNN